MAEFKKDPISIGTAEAAYRVMLMSMGVDDLTAINAAKVLLEPMPWNNHQCFSLQRALLQLIDSEMVRCNTTIGGGSING